MVESGPRSLGRLLRRSLPAATGVLAVVADAAPLPDAAPDAVAPFLLVIVVFYWTLHAPELMTPLVTFLLGLLFDALVGGPLGLTALALLLARGLLASRQRALMAQPAAVLWASFAIAAAAVDTVRWLLATLYWLHLFRVEPVAAELALTVLSYPLLAWLLGRVRGMVPRTRHVSGD